MHLLTMVHSFSLIVEVVSGIRVHVDVAAFAFVPFGTMLADKRSSAAVI